MQRTVLLLSTDRADCNSFKALTDELLRYDVNISYSAKDVCPDIIAIIGDRYELLQAVSQLVPLNIPIVHIGGGCITEGAFDDSIRHALTKLSHLHFVDTDYAKEIVLQLGEEPWRIRNVGSICLSAAKSAVITPEKCTEFIRKHKISKPFALVTCHPTTYELNELETQMDNIISTMYKFSKILDYVITYPNKDPRREVIISKFKEHFPDRLWKDLGAEYYTALSLCSIVFGNSSSGIIEAEYFKKPAVNIGTRQKSRSAANNVFHTGYSEDEIATGVTAALWFDSKNTKPIYGDGTAATEIARVIYSTPIDITKKIFVRRQP